MSADKAAEWVCPFCKKPKPTERELKKHLRKHLYRDIEAGRSSLESENARLREALNNCRANRFEGDKIGLIVDAALIGGTNG